MRLVCIQYVQKRAVIGLNVLVKVEKPSFQEGSLENEKRWSETALDYSSGGSCYADPCGASP